MKVSPYFNFNGNCSEAVELYEKAFSVKVAQVFRYKDAPASEGYQPAPGTENFIMHAEMKFGDDSIMFSDSEQATSFTNGISIHVALDNKEALEFAFNLLKDGGKVIMELGKTFWSECFGMLEDKFGVCWMLSL